jgi:hypothetical protein
MFQGRPGLQNIAWGAQQRAGVGAELQLARNLPRMGGLNSQLAGEDEGGSKTQY